MFRALLAHPQEVLHIKHLVYCVRVLSVGYTRIGVFYSDPGAANRNNTKAIDHVLLAQCRLRMRK
jgi:hypothetical protein